MEDRRKKIVDEIVSRRLVETCVQYRLNKCRDNYLKEELTQECYLWLLTYDIGKLEDAYMNNHLSALITAYIIRQWFSRTSDFYKRYKRLDALCDEITERELNLPDKDTL